MISGKQYKNKIRKLTKIEIIKKNILEPKNSVNEMKI